MGLTQKTGEVSLVEASNVREETGEILMNVDVDEDHTHGPTSAEYEVDFVKAAGTMLGSEESEIAVIGELLKDAVMQQEAANGGIG